MKRIIYLLLLVVVVLAGCKSSKHLATSETKTSTKAPTSSYLASRLQLTIPGKKGSMSVGGTMKMKTLPGGKTELTGKDIGIPSLEKAKVQLYEFSTQEFSMTPTELTSKYNQIPLEELVKMLVALL